MSVVGERESTRWSLNDAVAVPVALVFLAAGIWRHRGYFHDDAFISLRYALNLAKHGELTWNLGEPVEGYTNFLHLLGAAGLIRLGVAPETAVLAINLAGALVLVVVAFMAARVVAPGEDRALERIAAVVAVGATPGIAVWVTGGLEAVPLSAMLAAGLWGVLLLSRDPERGGVIAGVVLAFSLAVLTRMDAAVFIAASGLGLLLASGGETRKRLIAALVVVGVPALVSLGHMAWRYETYGTLLPLTFDAKTSLPMASRMAGLQPFFTASLTWAPIIALSVIGLFAGLLFRLRGRDFALLATVFGVHLAYVIWSGGDHMKGSRVLLVIVLPAALQLLSVAETLSRTAGRAIMVVAALASVVALYLRPPLQMDPAAYVGSIIGRHIAAEWPADSLVAVHTAGSTPFQALDLRFIDMLGLNDPVIAARKDVPIRAFMQLLPGHMKGDGAYVLSRKPDYIIAGFAQGSPVEEQTFLTDVELAELPEFAKCYEMRQENVAIPEDLAGRGEPPSDPLVFSFYERVCE
ncbi:hypothetical protein [Pseudoruegeria sp. HB172150]|uniref:hypothetical protein n=1 Tax=Pseudoruegeria sp. HB172150 TaxID=2721164 RepID=UPI001554E5DE|nr:hypothetical protein [Pseudoruegeria sp. HB172150]